MEMFTVITYIACWFLLWVMASAILVYKIQMQFNEASDLSKQSLEQSNIILKERQICINELERAYTKIDKLEHIKKEI